MNCLPDKYAGLALWDCILVHRSMWQLTWMLNHQPSRFHWTVFRDLHKWLGSTVACLLSKLPLCCQWVKHHMSEWLRYDYFSTYNRPYSCIRPSSWLLFQFEKTLLRLSVRCGDNAGECTDSVPDPMTRVVSAPQHLDICVLCRKPVSIMAG